MDEIDKHLNHGELPYEQYVDVDNGIGQLNVDESVGQLTRIADAEGNLVAYVPSSDAYLYVRLFNSYEPSLGD